MHDTKIPAFSLYWMGAPSRYDKHDDVLKSFPKGDLGGRYMALKMDVSPQKIFDVTVKMLKNIHAQGVQHYQRSGQPNAEVVFAQSIQMTWVFAAQEIARLNSRAEDLETRVRKLESLLASSEQPS